jgi:hypothetical protein
MSENYRHSATYDQMDRIIQLDPGIAQAWAAQLAIIHSSEVAIEPLAGQQLTVEGAAHILGIEITTEPIPGQYYILGPSLVGGVALWRQRVGTTRPSPSGRGIFKTERLD